LTETPPIVFAGRAELECMAFAVAAPPAARKVATRLACAARIFLPIPYPLAAAFGEAS
jgi:hypothetical protein